MGGANETYGVEVVFQSVEGAFQFPPEVRQVGPHVLGLPRRGGSNREEAHGGGVETRFIDLPIEVDLLGIVVISVW